MSEITIQDMNRIEFRMAPKTVMAILAAIVAALAMELLLPSRVSLILNIVMPLIAGLALLYMRIRFKNWEFGFLKPFLILLCFISPVIVLVKSFFYHVPGGPFYVFMMIDLIIGFIVAIIVKVKFGLEQDREKAVVISIFVAAFIFGSLLTDAYAKHFNYLFDSNEPVEYTTDIIQKREQEHSRRGRGSRTIYSLDLLVEGKKYSIQVNVSEYENYEIGDPYTVELHEGAFGKPFVLLK